MNVILGVIILFFVIEFVEKKGLILLGQYHTQTATVWGKGRLT